MKPQYFAAVAGFLSLTAIILMVMGRPQQVVIPEVPPPERRIAMIGEGEVRVKPDLVLVSLGVITIGASAAEAEALNLASVERTHAAIVTAGGEAEQLELSQPTVTAVTYQDYSGVLKITGFQAETRLPTRVNNLGRLQNVINAALRAGATSVAEVSYHVENPELFKQQTLAKALDNARNRAGSLLASDGASLGSLIDIEVLTVPSPVETSGVVSLVFRARVQATFSY